MSQTNFVREDAYSGTVLKDCHEGQCTDCIPECLPGDAECTGAVPAKGLSTEAFDRIMNWPMTKVIHRLRKENIIPEHQIDEAVMEFRKFIVVSLLGGKVGMISPIVDEVWHAFILHTVDYAEFSEAVAGRFIHHTPVGPGNPSDPQSVINFKEGYNRLFGSLPQIWIRNASLSGDCTVDPQCDVSDCGGGPSGDGCH